MNITFNDNNVKQLTIIEDRVKQLHLNSKRVQIFKADKALCAVLEISGTKSNADKLIIEMLQMDEIREFHLNYIVNKQLKCYIKLLICMLMRLPMQNNRTLQA